MTAAPIDARRDPRPDASTSVRQEQVREIVRPTSTNTRDDVLTVLGAAAGSVALTWLLYDRILPFHGTVGFIVAAYLIFIAFYAGLTALSRPLAVVVDRVMTAVVVAAPAIVGLALVDMVATTVLKGLKVLVHPNFFVHDMAGVRPTDGFTHGGILHAVIGTLIEIAIAVSIALPLGVTTAVYMSEVGGKGAAFVRTIVEAMTALPSIVAGLFVYSVLIIRLHAQSSGLCAALALSVMGLPIMARASDVVLRVVPGGLREASYALGAGRWQTVWRVVLPTARPGLATALILGIARMVGETSPLLLTSGATNFLNVNPVHNPMTSLPLYIYTAVSSGEPSYEARGYAAAVVLLVVVLTLFLLARLAAKQRTAR